MMDPNVSTMYVISDLHRGDKSPKVDDFDEPCGEYNREEVYASFLKKIIREQDAGLVINGDLDEFILNPEYYQVGRAYSEVLKLEDILRCDRRFVRIAGNHDSDIMTTRFWDPHITDEFDWTLVSVSGEKEYRVRFMHGHQFDKSGWDSGKPPMSFRIGGALLGFAEKFIHHSIDDRLLKIWINMNRKKNAKFYEGKELIYWTDVIQELFATDECDVAVLAHSHQAGIKEYIIEDKSYWYVNCGTWVRDINLEDRMDVITIEIDESGELSIEHKQAYELV